MTSKDPPGQEFYRGSLENVEAILNSWEEAKHLLSQKQRADKPLRQLVILVGSHLTFGEFCAHRGDLPKGVYHKALADLAMGLWMEFHKIERCHSEDPSF